MNKSIKKKIELKCTVIKLFRLDYQHLEYVNINQEVYNKLHFQYLHQFLFWAP